MPYNKVLRDVIDNSNYKNKQIIEELEKENIHIDKSYLSKLLNGKLSAPREEISRAIAKICNADERLLILEAYLDKAPQEIKDIFYFLKKSITVSITPIFSNITDVLDTNTLKLLDEQIKQEPLSDFLISLLDFKENDTMDFLNGNLSVSSNVDNFTFQMEEPISFLVNNDDMEPVIHKNSKITLEIPDEYKNGDIVAVKYNNEILVRYYFNNNNIVSFNAIKKDSILIDSTKKDTVILGKVKKVITEIQ